MCAPVPGELWAQLVPAKGHALASAAALMSCCAVQVPTRPSLVGTVARLLQEQGRAAGSRSCGVCQLCLCAAPGWGGEGEGAGGLALETEHHVCLSLEADLGLFCGAAVPSEKQTSAPLEQISSSQPHWKTSDWPAWVGVL